MTAYDIDYSLRNSRMKQEEFARYYAEARRAYNANPYDRRTWQNTAKDGDVIDADYTVVTDTPQIEDGSSKPKD